MGRDPPAPVVHLELRTGNLARACSFFDELFGWRIEAIHLAGATYHVVDLGTGIQGGVVEGEEIAPHWLPYVEVPDIGRAADRARALGALVEVEPREGPVGWRSELLTPTGGQIGLWQPKA